MPPLALVLPMAGRGSRFSRLGIEQPKPLIDLAGRPFFWWAVESVRRATRVGEMVFVVLEEHCAAFALDTQIEAFFPEARIVRLADVTSGAAETAKLGVDALSSDGPIAINDCDHAFLCPSLDATIAALGPQTASLLCFRSDSPAYSYLRLDEAGTVIGTVEKVVASPFAIAGCYVFGHREMFQSAYEAYRVDCPYNELFVSGLLNVALLRGGAVTKADLSCHISFGTPEELARIDPDEFTRTLPWVSRTT